MDGWNHYLPELRDHIRIDIRQLRRRYPHLILFFMSPNNFKPLVLSSWKPNCDGVTSRRRGNIFARRYYENRTVIEEHYTLWTQNSPPTPDDLSKTGQYLSISQTSELEWVWKIVSRDERWYLDDEGNLMWIKSHAILRDPWQYNETVQRDDFIMRVTCEARRVVGDW